MESWYVTVLYYRSNKEKDRTSENKEGRFFFGSFECDSDVSQWDTDVYFLIPKMETPTVEKTREIGGPWQQRSRVKTRDPTINDSNS